MREFILKTRHVLLILLFLVGALVFWAFAKKNEAPVVSFAKLKGLLGFLAWC